MPTKRTLQMQRPLVCFDLETTGLDVNNDRIIEISCVRIAPDGNRTTRTFRMNPQIPIHPEASAVHGIFDADVSSLPPFAHFAPLLTDIFSDCDLGGFNIERFDIPLLLREFSRANIEFDMTGRRIIDSWQIFLRKEPRDLKAAVRFYCDQELIGAHGAEADATAAADVLFAQIDRYSDLPQNIDELHTFCHPRNPNWLDPDGKIQWAGEHAVLTFGKHKNRPLMELAQEAPDYLRWMIGGDFSAGVKTVLIDVLAGKIPTRR